MQEQFPPIEGNPDSKIEWILVLLVIFSFALYMIF